MSDLETRALHCKRLIEDPYFKQAFEDVRAAIHEVFEESPVQETVFSITSLGILKLRLQLLDSVWDNLTHAISAQKLEQHKQQQPTFLGDLNGRESRNN